MSKLLPRSRRVAGICSALLSLLALGVLTSTAACAVTTGPAFLAWRTLKTLTTPVDLAGPGAGGVFTVAANGLLFHLAPNGALTPFARGPHGYSTPVGTEPYIALVPEQQPGGATCPFLPGSIAAIKPGKQPGVVIVDKTGIVRGFVHLPAGNGPSGITLDAVGRFGYRLLVTAWTGKSTTVFAIDCKGHVATVASGLPHVEGGIVVAPTTFGHFGGDLIAPAELTGLVYVVDPRGKATVLTKSNLPFGPDTGVESAGFVPTGFGAGSAAYLSDRFSGRNRYPGTNSILWIGGAVLLGVGVRPGDLLVAAEGGAETIVIKCTASCTVRHIANGFPISHGEGHIVFASPAIK